MANPSSKLEPFLELIRAERRRRTTYRRIAELLAEQGITVDHSTIHAFVKVRSKPPRKVITMYEPDTRGASPATAEIAARKTLDHAGTTKTTTPAFTSQQDAIERLKKANPAKRTAAKGLPSFREGAPLDRLSDDEAHRSNHTL